LLLITYLDTFLCHSVYVVAIRKGFSARGLPLYFVQSAFFYNTVSAVCTVCHIHRSPSMCTCEHGTKETRSIRYHVQCNFYKKLS